MADLKDIMKQRSGADCIKVDLHIHTPASPDDRYGIKPEKAGDDEIDIFASKFVDKLEGGGLKLVALTDHNTPGYVDHHDWSRRTWFHHIRKAIERRRSHVVVLPGCEITTDRSHILAIFDEKTPDVSLFKISYLLKQVGFEPENFGTVTTDIGERSVWDAIHMIVQLGGIAILAHIDGAGKSFGNSMFKRRGKELHIAYKMELKNIVVIPELSVYEYVDERSNVIPEDPKSGKWIKVIEKIREKAHLGPEIRFMRNSDAHDLEAIGKRFSYVKLDSPSFKSLFYALREPSMRVRADREGPFLKTATYIDGLIVKGGFIDGTAHRFSPWLNCIVSKDATGKTLRIRLLERCLSKKPTAISQAQEERVVYATIRIETATGTKIYAVRCDSSKKGAHHQYAELSQGYGISPKKWSDHKPSDLADFEPVFLFGEEIKEDMKKRNRFDIPLVAQSWEFIKDKLKISGVNPIVFDDPEACLDDDLIYDELVPLVRDERLRRQIIITTIDPNIPVNAIYNEEGRIIHQPRKSYTFEVTKDGYSYYLDLGVFATGYGVPRGYNVELLAVQFVADKMMVAK